MWQHDTPEKTKQDCCYFRRNFPSSITWQLSTLGIYQQAPNHRRGSPENPALNINTNLFTSLAAASSSKMEHCRAVSCLIHKLVAAQSCWGLFSSTLDFMVHDSLGIKREEFMEATWHGWSLFSLSEFWLLLKIGIKDPIRVAICSKRHLR